MNLQAMLVATLAAIGLTVAQVASPATARSAARLEQELAAALKSAPGGARVVVSAADDGSVRVRFPATDLFALDSARLRPNGEAGMAALVAVAAAMRKRLGRSELQVEVYSDSWGAREFNEDFTFERASTVALWLRARKLPAAQITAFGGGEGAPIADDATPEGRATNRRVELVVRPRAPRAAS